MTSIFLLAACISQSKRTRRLDLLKALEMTLYQGANLAARFFTGGRSKAQPEAAFAYGSLPV